MEKVKTYLKMFLYMLGIVFLFCLFIQFISVYDNMNSSLNCLLLIIFFVSLLVGCYFFIYLLHGQIIYLDYLSENSDVIVVKRKGVKYLGNIKNSNLVVSIFKTGELKFLDSVPVDVIADMLNLMDNLVLNAHV